MSVLWLGTCVMMDRSVRILLVLTVVSCAVGGVSEERLTV